MTFHVFVARVEQHHLEAYLASLENVTSLKTVGWPYISYSEGGGQHRIYKER